MYYSFTLFKNHKKQALSSVCKKQTRITLRLTRNAASMKHCIKLFCSTCCLILVSFICFGEAASHGKGKQIFNGTDLSGWAGKPGWWYIEDGTLTSESTAQKPCKACNYLIWKGGQPSDFELTLDFKLSEKGNSGVQIRSKRVKEWDTCGYQADMTGDGKLIGFVYHHKRGLIAGRGQDVKIADDGSKDIKEIESPEELLKCFKKGEWNNYRIVCQGQLIQLYINGTLMCRFEDRGKEHAAKKGIIALQMHPGPPMKVQFKNIFLKELK